MKTGKRIISLLLCAIMVFGMFSGVDFGIESSIFELEASAADITLGGITQQRVVSNYESLYKGYQQRFFTGRDSNSPTNFVIPGLDKKDNYTPQGMTYWEEKEWILISAYDASVSGKHSVIYALDAVTTEFVALFKILNANGSVNTSHGGGIAASKYNFYYADSGSNISYFPLSELDVPKGTVKEVKLKGSINCGGELGGAATSYCCYEDGVLWAGNFYYDGDDRYKTKAHSSFDSMIVGYKLRGNSSEEEWSYLSTGKNLDGSAIEHQDDGAGCAGDPTYVIGIVGIDKIQYAMVFKGKIYVSRSWKRVEDTNHSRELMVTDIDINSPGTETLTINGRNRPCHMIKYNEGIANGSITRFGGDNGNAGLDKMFYMGEALCVMNDYLYMFAESAAAAYRDQTLNRTEKTDCDGNPTGEYDNGDICEEPIDVIWKIDQYAIMGEKRPAEEVAVSHYQKVNSLAELQKNNSNDEYLIVFESTLKDPVTQKNIIYALDSFGGYGDKKLPKQDAGEQRNTGDSMGIIGYSITDYNKSDDGNTLYITDEDDANRSIRWRINGAGTSSLRIDNTDLYYSKNNHLYFGSRLFAMTTDKRTNLDRIKIEESGTGGFYLYYNGDLKDAQGNVIDSNPYYLWCNDGRYQSYINAYTNYYSNHGKSGYVPAYHGLEEVPGTFHADGLKGKPVNESGNIMDTKVDTALGLMHIYKRVPDPYSSVYDTQVFTDLNAELQADGTYKIDLETYAVNKTQYQKVDERPTDFIFVLDTSGVMTGKDATGYHTESGWSPLLMGQACGDKSGSFFNEGENYNKAFSGNFFFKFPDGEFGRIHVAYNKKDDNYTRDIWLWAEHPVTKRCYRLSKFGFMTKGNFAGGADWNQDSGNRITDEDFLKNHQSLGWANEAAVMADVNADRYRTDFHSSRNSDEKRRTYEVMYYKYADANVVHSYYTYIENCTRLEGMQQAVEKLTYKIASSELDHRIAVVQYGGNSGIYTNSGTSLPYSGSISDANYKNAFFSKNNFSTVRTIINNITATGNDSIPEYGIAMANNIIRNSAAENRSSCIIMLTGSVPRSNNGNSQTLANNAISSSGIAKQSGAFVYAVQLGNDAFNGFDMDAYVDYVSSEFINATSMENPGDRNISNIEYRVDVPTGNKLNLDNFVNEIFNSVTSNSTSSLSNLDANSVIREQISDAFDLSNSTVTVNYATPMYDGLDRLYFDDPKPANDIAQPNIKTIIDNNNTVTVTGYDYSKHYVAPSNENAKKLVVTFTGVTPNVNAELDNTNINNTGTTAIYQNASALNSGVAYKNFPTEMFSIPEYTYVLDFGINMLDTDVNGTLKSVDSLPRQQKTYSELLNSSDSDAIIGFTPDNQNLLYSLQPDASGDEARSRGYVLIQRDDGTYDWFRINVVPASNVLFEENSASVVSGSGADWKTENAGSKISTQSLTSVNDVYGYDEAYNSNVGDFSNGSSSMTEVSSSTNRSKTLTFDYTGTAVDIISACGPKTGIQIVTIKDSDGKAEKVYIIDTYYTDDEYLTNGLLRQVPVVHHENKDGYGTYTVEVTAAYLSSMVNARPFAARSLYSNNAVNFYTPDVKDMAAEAVLTAVGMEELLDADIDVLFADENSVLNGGTGAAAPAISTFALTRNGSDRDFSTLENYFDGFRVYNPLGVDSEEADYVESEKGAKYYNVINSLASSSDIISGTGDNLVAYVEGETKATINFADYAENKSNAPMNEVYLSRDNEAIGFNVQAGEGAKIMVSLRAVSGSPQVKIGNTAFEYVPSSTEMYYDITDYVGDDGLVTIQNSGTGLLAVCNIKVVNGGIMPTTTFALPRMRMMMAMPVEEEVIPNQPKVEEPVINPDLTPDGPVINPDTDLDGEGEIPDYVPDVNEPDDSVDTEVSVFEEFIDMIKSFIDRVITFFKTIFNVMGGK